MPLRCITFDLDDTLWETGPVIARAEAHAHAWLETHAPRITSGRSESELLEHRRAHYATLPEHSHDFTALRRHWLISMAVEAGYDEQVGQEAFDVFWLARNEVVPFPSALKLLDDLKPEFTLGTITNGNADIAHIGLGHHFDFTVTAADAGVMKPHADIFTYALGLAGVDAGHALHVGDDPVTDVQGAKAAGMRAVWVNPDERPWDDTLGPAPDATVAEVAELGAILEQWSRA